MARILYGLCGENLGHVSRAIAIAEDLRALGHSVAFAGGGRAAEVLGERGELVLIVPVVQQVVRRHRVQYLASARRNVVALARRVAIARRLAPRVAAIAPDLVVSDYEPFCADAADLAGLPVVTLDHQQVVTELVHAVPARWRVEAALTAAVIRHATARHPMHRIVTSFFDAPLRAPGAATVVGPILRRQIRAARPERHEHVLVYLNQGDGRTLLDVLGAVDGRFVVVGGQLRPQWRPSTHVIIRPLGDRRFVEDLATARAVVCTAGHGLLGEALHLGKPVLALPLGGTFEQTLNALALERTRLGCAVIGRPLRPADLREFLGRVDEMADRARQHGPVPAGNADAVARLLAVIEEARQRRAA